MILNIDEWSMYMIISEPDKVIWNHRTPDVHLISLLFYEWIINIIERGKKTMNIKKFTSYAVALMMSLSLAPVKANDKLIINATA